ncbi:MAG: sensor histidine kinase [Candidatus Limnocylindrales bacterium]
MTEQRGQASQRSAALYAEAKQTLSYAANQLRALAERSRSVTAELQLELRNLRREDQADGDASADGPAEVLRRHRLDELGGQVVRARSELARLDLAVQGLEANWLFLERGGEASSRLPDGTDPALRMVILDAQEAERARLAQEIHDGPAQALANAIFQVDILQRTLERDPGAASDELRGLRDLLRRELADLRGFINQLRPPLLEELGLDRALSESAAQLAGAGGRAVEVDLRAPDDLLSEARQTVVLRVAQEALRNVRKHAEARRVRVSTRLETRDDGGPGHWILEVGDDGRGFEPPDRLSDGGGQHFGLRFMRERADMIGAQLTIEAAAGSGTIVRLTIILS